MRADKNQEEIVKALRSVGATVHCLSKVGNGFPDLCVGIFGKNYLIEVKNIETRGKLHGEQIIFKEKWKGKVHTVYSVEDALKVLGVNI